MVHWKEREKRVSSQHCFECLHLSVSPTVGTLSPVPSTEFGSGRYTTKVALLSLAGWSWGSHIHLPIGSSAAQHTHAYTLVICAFCTIRTSYDREQYNCANAVVM